MRILFISRAYPPIVGGIENQNYDLSIALSQIAKVKILANRRGRKFLPFFAPLALVYTLLNLRKYDVIVLGDAVLSLISWFVKKCSPKPVIIVVHGLDVSYASSSLGVWYENVLIKIYQKIWTKTFLPSADRYIAVGNETKRLLLAKMIDKEKIAFIPNGIYLEKFNRPFERNELSNFLKIDLYGKKLILTSGRLVARKGVSWFINNIVPLLPLDVIYIIAGDGPDKNNIIQAINDKKLSGRVKLLGFVSDGERNLLFKTCDIFVQPNIKVEGDIEGFGISVIEAAYCGIPVIASNIEGLKDAIQHEKSGFLINSEDVQGFVNKINELLANDEIRIDFAKKASSYIADNFNWKKISQQYLNEIEKTVSGTNHNMNH